MSDKKKKVAPKVKAKTGKDKPNGVQPAPKNGPNLTLRMRTDTQINQVKRAAAKAGLSMNTWAVEVLGRAAAAAQ